MTGYTPDAPVDTVNPCGGESWRTLADGTVQCLSEFIATRDLAATGATIEVVAIIFGAALLLVGIVALNVRKRADR